MLSSGEFVAVCPGGVFVVDGVVAEAAVEEADESVAECSQGTGVGVAGGSTLVVEGSGARAGGEGGEGPLVADVGEAPVAGVAGEHDVVFAGRSGDG